MSTAKHTAAPISSLPERWSWRSVSGFTTIKSCTSLIASIRCRPSKPSGAGHGRIISHILWFGCWGSKHHDAGGMRDILSIKDELNGFDDLALTICSNSRELFQRVSGELSIPTAYEEWDRNTFGSLLRRHHAVIIPVVDTPYTRAKSHNRVTTAI